MLGPLIATSLASILGRAHGQRGPAAQRRAVGSSEPRWACISRRPVVQLIAGLWWAIAVAIVWALLLGWGFGAWLYRVHAPRMPQIPAGEMRRHHLLRGRHWRGL